MGFPQPLNARKLVFRAWTLEGAVSSGIENDDRRWLRTGEPFMTGGTYLGGPDINVWAFMIRAKRSLRSRGRTGCVLLAAHPLQDCGRMGAWSGSGGVVLEES